MDAAVVDVVVDVAKLEISLDLDLVGTGKIRCFRHLDWAKAI